MYTKNNLGSYGGLGSVWGDASDKSQNLEAKPTDKIKFPKTGTDDAKRTMVSGGKSPHHLEDGVKPRKPALKPSPAATPAIQVSRPLIPSKPTPPPKEVKPKYYLDPTMPFKDISTDNAAKEALTVAKEGIIVAKSDKEKIPAGRTYWTASGPVFSKNAVDGGTPMEFVPPPVYQYKPLIKEIKDLPKLKLSPIALSGFGDYVSGGLGDLGATSAQFGNYISNGLGDFGVGDAVETGIFFAVLSLLILGVCHYNKKP